MPDYLGGPADKLALLVSIGGSLLTLLAAMIIYAISMRNIRFQELVEDRTAELSQNSMLIQLTMDSIDQGFAVWNADRRLVVWSKRCVDFWYHPKGLRPGMHMSDLLKHLAERGALGQGIVSDIVDQKLEQIVVAGAQSDEKFEMTDGRRLHVRRFPLERGGHVSVYTDITEREKAIEELTRSRDDLERRVAERTHDLKRTRDEAIKANETKSEFMANMSHELRTPLNAIIGFSQLAAYETFGPLGNSKYRENASIVATAGEYLLQLISDILDLSKIEANALSLDNETIDLAEVINTVVSLVLPKARESGVTISSEVRKDLPFLQGDVLRVTQMILNLADNAVKYTAVGGTVSLTAGITQNKCLEIRVTDNGVGIPDENIALVILPFNQVNSNNLVRKSEGVGLGLALVNHLVEMHGGKLSLESKLGRGTTATLQFPSARTISRQRA